MPGMPDYPAHLASFALIAGAPSQYYEIHWQALPNLASEVLVPLLGRLMPLETATRLFLTTAIGLWVLGAALIRRALFGRVGPGVLLSALFAYNANFIWGFFNYSFAAGLAFVVFAAWIATDGRRRPWHLAGFALAFLVVYFCHLFALAVLLLAIGGYELKPLIAERFAAAAMLRRVLAPALLCLPAAFAFVVLKPHGADISHVGFSLIETFVDRINAAIQIGFDRPVLALTLALIGLFGWAVVTKRAAIHPRMTYVLALFAVATLFAPEWAFGGWGVHMRLPAVLGLLAFASLEWKVAPRVQTAGAIVILAAITLGALALARDWRTYDRQYAEFRAHADAIKPGGRLMVALDGDSLGWAPDQPYWHLAEFAIIDRGAFTPLMFATAGQHVVHIRPPFDLTAAQTAQQGSPPDVDELSELAAGETEDDEDYMEVLSYLNRFQCHFDQVVAIEGAGPHAAVPPTLRLRAAGSFYRLYDVVPDKSCQTR